jgi:hypothetical protein
MAGRWDLQLNMGPAPLQTRYGILHIPNLTALMEMKFSVCKRIELENVNSELPERNSSLLNHDHYIPYSKYHGT